MSRRKLFYRARHGGLDPAKRSEYALKLMASHGSARDTKGNICSRPMREDTAKRIAGIIPPKEAA